MMIVLVGGSVITEYPYLQEVPATPKQANELREEAAATNVSILKTPGKAIETQEEKQVKK